MLDAIRSRTEVSRGRHGGGGGRLAALGAGVSAAEEEVDLYFAHPQRDFAATDEALRLRQKGVQGYITYKGPKIDATTKTRREIELPLGEAAGAVAAWRGLLEVLGFRGVAEVRKSRRKALVSWQDRQVEVSLDVVEGLGTFVELELMADSEAGGRGQGVHRRAGRPSWASAGASGAATWNCCWSGKFRGAGTTVNGQGRKPLGPMSDPTSPKVRQKGNRRYCPSGLMRRFRNVPGAHAPAIDYRSFGACNARRRLLQSHCREIAIAAHAGNPSLVERNWDSLQVPRSC